MEGKYVFISYKVEDSDDAVWVKETLESNGIQCWMAPDSIPGGSSYASEIENSIKDCSAFVLVLSEKAQGSKWVSKELDRAINFGKRVMPFTLDDAPLKNDFSFYLSNVQRYDATTDKLAAIQTMIEDIREEFNAPQTNIVFKEKPPKSKKQQDKTLKSKIQKILIVIGILTILSYILAFCIGFSDDSPSGESTSGVTESNETSTHSDQNYSSSNIYTTKETSKPALSSHQNISRDLSSESFFFFLNGVKYKHPCTYSDLKNNGWELYSDQYSESTVLDDSVVVRLRNSDYYITAEIINTSRDPNELRDCTVGGIYVKQNFHNTDFMAPSGIKIGSSRDEVTNAYGMPNSTETYDEYIMFSYRISRGFGELKICFDKQTNKCYLIEFRNNLF